MTSGSLISVLVLIYLIPSISFSPVLLHPYFQKKIHQRSLSAYFPAFVLPPFHLHFLSTCYFYYKNNFTVCKFYPCRYRILSSGIARYCGIFPDILSASFLSGFSTRHHVRKQPPVQKDRRGSFRFGTPPDFHAVHSPAVLNNVRGCRYVSYFPGSCPLRRPLYSSLAEPSYGRPLSRFFNIFAACQLRSRRCAGIFKNFFCGAKSRLSAILHDQHMFTEAVDLIAAVRHHQNVFVITGQKF